MSRTGRHSTLHTSERCGRVAALPVLRNVRDPALKTVGKLFVAPPSHLSSICEAGITNIINAASDVFGLAQRCYALVQTIHKRLICKGTPTQLTSAPLERIKAEKEPSASTRSTHQLRATPEIWRLLLSCLQVQFDGPCPLPEADSFDPGI